MSTATQYRTLDPCELREEAHKSWQHAIAEELVYTVNPVGVHDHAVMGVPKVYLEGNAWIELHLVFHGKREAHYTAIIERFPGNDSINLRQLEDNLAPVRRDAPVLVEITHSVQPPQKVRLWGTRSLIRLKQINLFDGIGGNASEVPEECLAAVGVKAVVDWKSNLSGNDSRLPCQGEDQLIQRRSETVDYIADDKLDRVWYIEKLKPQDVPLVLKVFLFGHSIGGRFTEGIKLPIKRLQMFLRPTNLQIGVREA